MNIDPNAGFMPFSPGSITASFTVNTLLAAGTYYVGVIALTDPDIDGQESIFVAGGAGSGGTLANPGGSWGAYNGPGNSWDVGSKLGYRLDGLQGVAGVPEPASWALMIAGFGFVGAGGTPPSSGASGLPRLTSAGRGAHSVAPRPFPGSVAHSAGAPASAQKSGRTSACRQ